MMDGPLLKHLLQKTIESNIFLIIVTEFCIQSMRDVKVHGLAVVVKNHSIIRSKAAQIMVMVEQLFTIPAKPFMRKFKCTFSDS